MNRLIIIAGASGAGKSFLLHQISMVNGDIVPIKKLSTRGPRDYERQDGVSVDLMFDCTLKEIQTCKYTYRYGDNSYGIRKEDIDEALNNDRMPFVIVRDCDEIIELKQDYNNALVLYLQSGYSGADLANILLKQGRNDIDIVKRDERTQKDYLQYIQYPGLFDHVLMNYYDQDTLVTHFKSIFRIEKEKYARLPQIRKNSIFVIMSFDANMNTYYNSMKSAAKFHNSNVHIERIDDNPGDYKIDEELLTKIQTAEIIICDLTKERPNVYYELGYARGIGKTVILLAKVGTKIHFDTKMYHTELYTNERDLKRRLLVQLEHFYDKE